MPRYFFDVNDGTEHRDEIGRDLDDRRALREEALLVATAVLKAEAFESKDTALVLSVRDVNTDTQLRIRLVCQIEDA